MVADYGARVKEIPDQADLATAAGQGEENDHFG